MLCLLLLLCDAQVNYVGKAANLYQDAGYKLSGSAYVIEKHLGTSWLWDKVRGIGRDPEGTQNRLGVLFWVWLKMVAQACRHGCLWRR